MVGNVDADAKPPVDSACRGRGDPATLRASYSDVDKRLQHAKRKFDELNARIEATRGAADYLTQHADEQLAGYLNLPENARRLFDPAAPG